MVTVLCIISCSSAHPEMLAADLDRHSADLLRSPQEGRHLTGCQYRSTMENKGGPTSGHLISCHERTTEKLSSERVTDPLLSYINLQIDYIDRPHSCC